MAGLVVGIGIVIVFIGLITGIAAGMFQLPLKMTSAWIIFSIGMIFVTASGFIPANLPIP
jgi:hypothetical protein